jgi:heme-degrading monooxygenase HmoA
VTTIHSPAERMDEGIDTVRQAILGEMKGLQGFRGLIGLIDRQGNAGLTISLWDTEEAMAASEDAGERLREQAAKAMKAETEPFVKRYEVALFEVEAPVSA